MTDLDREKPCAVSLRGLIKRFPGFQLGPLDLDLEPGTVLALIGLVALHMAVDILNEWSDKGWTFDNIQFAMRKSSKRPSMAFVTFTRPVGEAEEAQGGEAGSREGFRPPRSAGRT